MSDIEKLKQLLNYIRRRLPDEDKIDAAEHNRILNNLVDTLAGIGVDIFKGNATPETIPDLPTSKCFYLATKKGNYTHFGDLTVNTPLAVISWNGIDWEKHEIEVVINVNVNIDDYIDLSNFAKLSGDNLFNGKQQFIGTVEVGETRGKLRPVARTGIEMKEGQAVVWDAILQAIKTVEKVPDSMLLDGHDWDSNFNQPVKTDSNVEFKSLIASYLKSIDFASGLTGYKVGTETEVDILRVRKFFEATEYLLNQISLVGDEVILTEGGQIDRVEAIENGYYRVILRENSIRTGELKKFDICMTDFKIETGFRVIKFEITEVIDKGTIIVYPEDPAYPPREMMTFKRFANTVDKTRQNSIRLSARDQIIEMLSGVDSYNPTAKNRDILIGRIRDLLPDLPGVPEFIKQQATAYMQNIILSGTILQTSADGITQQRVPCYKGIWTAEKAPFFYYDQVTDGYVRYTCIYKGEEGTREEPRFDSDKWEVADGDTVLSMKMYSNTGSFEFWDRLDILFDATVNVFSGSKPINAIVNEWEWWIDTGDAEFDTAWKSLHGSSTNTQPVDGSTFPTDMKPGVPVLLWCRAKIFNNGKVTQAQESLNLN